MPTKNVVVTMVIGDGRGPESRWEVCPFDVNSIYPMSALSVPVLQHYARRIGADFHIIQTRLWPDRHVFFEKFQIWRLLEFAYERAVYFDADILIRGDAPNIFDYVPPHHFGVLNEAKWHHPVVEAERRIGDLWAYAGGPPGHWKWNGIYANTGLFVIDRGMHQMMRDKPPVHLSHMHYGDQGFFNLKIQQDKIPVFDLTPKWNLMTIFEPAKLVPELCQEMNVLHFAAMPVGQRVEMMKQALDCWKKTYA